MKEEMFKEPAAPQNAPIEASKPSPSPTLPWVSAPIKMPLPDLPKVGDVVKCRDCGVVYRALSYRTTQACMECDSKYIKKTLRQPDNEQPNVTQKTYAENEGDSAIYIGGTLDGKSKTVLTPPQKPEIVKESQKVEVEPKKEEVKVNNWEPVIEKTKVPEKKPRKERPGNDWLVAKDKPEKELNNAPPDGPTPLKRVQNSIAGVRMHLGQEKKRGDKEKVEKLTKVLESLEKKKKELEAATPGATNDKS